MRVGVRQWIQDIEDRVGVRQYRDRSLRNRLGYDSTDTGH